MYWFWRARRCLASSACSFSRSASVLHTSMDSCAERQPCLKRQMCTGRKKRGAVLMQDGFKGCKNFGKCVSAGVLTLKFPSVAYLQNEGQVRTRLFAGFCLS
uniref:Putative secreted protein n=1 Tax=Ixodes ricinus TaxID=34613 RepID=A0A6B0UFF6_IXORI